MKPQSQQLQKIIQERIIFLDKIPNEKFTLKKNPEKWSKKEIAGHLIDSAQNNIQRFIRGQYEVEPSISYNQDFWVQLNNYQESDAHNLISLLKLLNEQIIAIWENIPAEDLLRKCKIGNEIVTIEWVMNEYLVHLNYHLDQIKKP
jgi:hypothetical protein